MLFQMKGYYVTMLTLAKRKKHRHLQKMIEGRNLPSSDVKLCYICLLLSTLNPPRYRNTQSVNLIQEQNARDTPIIITVFHFPMQNKSCLNRARKT